MDKNAKCRTCVYWKSSDTQIGEGECRESAPVVIVRGISQSSVWPTTASVDWCGKWSFDATKV